MTAPIHRIEVLIVGATQLAMIIGTFLALKLFTNLLPISEYGLLSLGLAIITGFQMVYSAMSNALLRYLPIARAQNDLRGYRKGLQGLVRLSLGVPVALVFLLGLVLLLFGEPVLPLYVLAVIVACAAGLASWAQTILLALRKRGQVLGLTVITYILRPVVAVIAMLSFGFSADVVLWAFVVVQLLTLPVAQFLTHRALDGLPEDQSGPTARDPADDYRATFVRYGVYFLAAGVLVALILQGDRWLIKSNLGLAELGLYGAILTIASVTTNLVFSFMSQLMTPVIFQKFGSSHGDAHEGKQAYRTYILVSVGIFLVALALITLLREPVILLLTDRTFLAAAGLLPILTAAQAIEKLGQSVTLRGLAALRTWPYLWARLIQLLVLLAGGYYGVMTSGIIGVAYAQLAACACYFLVTWATNWVLLDMPRRDAGAKG